MKITRQETSPREVVLSIELESADVEPYLDRSYRRVVNRVQIPGFRPGKAPRWRVEQIVGRESLVRESLDLIVQESLSKAIGEENLETFGEPDIELLEVNPVSFKAVLPLEPIVDLGDFRSLRLEPEPVEVTEAQVNRVLEQVRYDAAPWEPVDRPVKFGDLVTLDVDGFIEGEQVVDDRGVDFIPSQDNPIPFPGFSVYMEGMKKSEPKEFTLKVPDDYNDTTIAGKECRFRVTALEIKEKLLPALDDEFAKGVGDGYESLEALRASVLHDLTEQTERMTQLALQERSLEQVVSGASVEVSGLTTDREIDHILEEQLQARQGRRTDMDTYLQNVGKSQEELRNELRPTAQQRLTRVLVLRKLAQEEGIQISPEEIDAEVERITAGSGESREALLQAFSTENGRASIGSALLARKVLERLAQIVRGGVEEGGESQEEGPGPEQAAQAPAEASTEGPALPHGVGDPSPPRAEEGQPQEAQEERR